MNVHFEPSSRVTTASDENFGKRSNLKSNNLKSIENILKEKLEKSENNFQNFEDKSDKLLSKISSRVRQKSSNFNYLSNTALTSVESNSKENNHNMVLPMINKLDNRGKSFKSLNDLSKVDIGETRNKTIARIKSKGSMQKLLSKSDSIGALQALGSDGALIRSKQSLSRLHDPENLTESQKNRMLAIKNRQEKLAASQLQQFQLQPQEQKKIRKKEKLASIEMLNKITLSNPENTQEKKFNYSLYDNCDTSNPFVSNCENASTNERNIALKFSSQNDLTSGQDTGNVQLSATSVDQMEHSTNALYNTKENLSSSRGHLGRVAFKASKENISISPEDI
ncbi:hypothetical protein HDU92_007236, partial [Lobulomyces angularis]